MENISCAREKKHQAAAQRAKEGTLPDSDLEKICKIFQMLSDPGRLKIVSALMNGEMCVYHLTEVCGGSTSSVSHQLRLLRDNDIVKARRMGKNMEYSIADEHVREIVNMGVAHLHCEVDE